MYGDLRLVQRTVVDSQFTSGRVEIYINGQWGTICDDLFDQTDASVTCKQLGFADAVSFRTSASAGSVSCALIEPTALDLPTCHLFLVYRFHSGTGPIWLDDLQCTASDTRLISCSHRAVGTHSCGHSEDIAVYCTNGKMLTLQLSLL